MGKETDGLSKLLFEGKCDFFNFQMAVGVVDFNFSQGLFDGREDILVELSF